MTEYRSAIVDELGAIMYWCDDLSEAEIYNILIEHPEWERRCIDVAGEEWVYEWV